MVAVSYTHLLEKEAATGAPAGAMVLPDGHVVTGKTGDLLGAASALLMHALKAVTGVDETIPVIDDCLLYTSRCV